MFTSTDELIQEYFLFFFKTESILELGS